MKENIQRGLPPMHPGELLLEDFNELNFSKVEFAEKLGISRQHLDRIFKGETPINANVAVRVSALFGTTARLWLNLQAQYDIWRYREEHKEELKELVCVA